MSSATTLFTCSRESCLNKVLQPSFSLLVFSIYFLYLIYLRRYIYAALHFITRVYIFIFVAPLSPTYYRTHYLSLIKYLIEPREKKVSGAREISLGNLVRASPAGRACVKGRAITFARGKQIYTIYFASRARQHHGRLFLTFHVGSGRCIPAKRRW